MEKTTDDLKTECTSCQEVIATDDAIDVEGYLFCASCIEECNHCFSMFDLDEEGYTCG